MSACAFIETTCVAFASVTRGIGHQETMSRDRVTPIRVTSSVRGTYNRRQRRERKRGNKRKGARERERERERDDWNFIIHLHSSVMPMIRIRDSYTAHSG